jgi:O-antigen ligase
VAFFVLFASVRTLQNLGFGWKAMLARLSNWDWISRFDTTWNAKFNESWVLLAMWSLIAVALARRDSLGPRAAWLLAVSGAAVLMTGYSRTSQLAFLVGCIVFWLALKSPRHARTVTTAVLLALTLGAPIFGSLSWNWYLKNSSLLEVQPLLAQRLTPRLLVWGYTASMVGQRPVVGWGPGAADRSPARTLPAIEVWDEAVQLPESQRARRLLPGGHPHNAPLLIWFETGFIGILFLIGFLWSVMRNSYNCRGSSQLAAYLALVVSAFFIFWFNYPLLMPEPIFLLVAVCGIYAMASVSDVETPVVETRTPRLE